MLESLRSIVTSLAIASVIGTVAQGYASTSTQASPAQSHVAAAGIAVKNIDYVTSGSALQAVTFTVGDADALVSIRLSEGGQWIPCANSNGAVRCDAKDYPVSALTNLEIAARG